VRSKSKRSSESQLSKTPAVESKAQDGFSLVWKALIVDSRSAFSRVAKNGLGMRLVADVFGILKGSAFNSDNSLCLGSMRASIPGDRARGSHIDVACRSICDRDQNEIKRSTFLLGADQGIKMNSEPLISSD